MVGGGVKVNLPCVAIRFTNGLLVQTSVQQSVAGIDYLLFTPSLRRARLQQVELLVNMNQRT